MTTDSKPRLVYQIIIKAPQERVWEAITTSEFTSRYYYGSTLKTDLTVGSPFTYHMPNGSPIVEGEVVASEPPNRLVHTYHSLWPPMNEDAPTRVTWELESMPGGVTKVTVVHEDFQGETATYTGLAGRRLDVDPQQHEDAAGDRRADACRGTNLFLYRIVFPISAEHALTRF